MIKIFYAFEIIQLIFSEPAQQHPLVILKYSLITQTFIKSKHGTNSNEPVITNVNKLSFKLPTKGRVLVIN